VPPRARAPGPSSRLIRMDGSVRSLYAT
jgi:hypothetical protein